MTNYITLSKMVRTPLNGHCYSHGYLSKIRDTYDIPSKGKGPKQANVYDPQDFIKAIEQDKGIKNDSTMGALREEKIKKEIAILERELQQRDIQIEKLKDTLIPAEEVKEYLIKVKSVWCGALKKVLLSQLPLEIPGQPTDKARELAEGYYNSIMSEVTKPSIYEES